MQKIRKEALMKFVDLGKEYAEQQNELEWAFRRVLENAHFIKGPELEAFEKEFAQFCDSRFCVGTSSGTTALHLALLACGVGKGHEVITTPYTFFATAEAVVQCGAKPVFVDIDPQTYNMNVELIESAITERTRAILPVHLFGYPADMAPIMDLANTCGLKVIEDACQAHGAMYQGSRVGSIGHVAAFSFYPTKNLGACGDAGALVTNDPKIEGRARLLRHHGRRERDTHEEIGYSYLMDGLQAAFLRVKLKLLADWNLKRRELAQGYNDCLQGLRLQLPFEREGDSHVYHIYTVRAERWEVRDKLKYRLAQEHVPTMIYYAHGLHMQPAFSYLAHTRGQFPVSELCSKTCLSLPLYPQMRLEELELVVERIVHFYTVSNTY